MFIATVRAEVSTVAAEAVWLVTGGSGGPLLVA